MPNAADGSSRAHDQRNVIPESAGSIGLGKDADAVPTAESVPEKPTTGGTSKPERRREQRVVDQRHDARAERNPRAVAERQPADVGPPGSSGDSTRMSADVGAV
jgi:hypothetical protein